MDATAVLGQQGRFVIPVAIREALKMSAGDRLILRSDGDRLIVERSEDPVAALRSFASGIPAERSLVDELLAERRAAAADE